jgi:hypothetical protein
MSPVIRSCRLIDVPFWWPGRFAKDNGDLRKDGGEYGELSVAAIDDPSRIRRSRDIGVYLGLVPRRYQSGGSTMWAASPNAAIGGCGRCFTRPPMSC